SVTRSRGEECLWPNASDFVIFDRFFNLYKSRSDQWLNSFETHVTQNFVNARCFKFFEETSVGRPKTQQSHDEIVVCGKDVYPIFNQQIQQNSVEFAKPTIACIDPFSKRMFNIRLVDAVIIRGHL